MAQVSFMTNPRPELDSRKPIEVLAEGTAGNFEAVCEAAGAYA